MSSSKPAYQHKSYAYATRQSEDTEELLVFRERAAPDLGTQVPKGGIEGGETPAVAVRRELREEAGLDHDRPVYHLASDRRCRPDGKRIARHFFHLSVAEPCDEWAHEVSGDGEDAGAIYDLFWQPLPLSDRLTGGMDCYLSLIGR